MPFSVKDSPVLIVDVGNTNIVCALFEGDSITAVYRFETKADRSPEDYHNEFQAAITGYCAFTCVAIGSVVPEVGDTIKAMFSEYTDAKVYEINGLSPIGLSYATDNPAKVGADLVANALAAWKLYETNTIVVDLGTATTIQLISDSGFYAGVAIIPGLKTAAAHLFDHAALLSEVKLEAPPFVLGNNTHDALLTGIVRGHALMIQAFVESIRREYPAYAPSRVILTGGLAQLINDLVPKDYILDSRLTLKGFHLALISLVEQENR
jgi:type III pantothenate kinase